ncbi:hypothetical protein GOP47_0000532 [Adiantum capillus-veneris]|uniref:Major facilitator superfamily (MFS) profile domain-containing protein n=1 Tax=Adiantum capillus-veneris TaxID=13818 RepID=A0A9D4VF53_ADICA|nr:hypothetical protein GOP47_0000532 [Adiantum capillus-veneris]
MVVGAVNISALTPAQQILNCGRNPLSKVQGAHLSTHWTIFKSADYRPSLLLSRRRFPPSASISEEPAPAVQQPDVTLEELHSSTEISSHDMQGVVPSFDWGWVPAFPHALTASMANFMFGYHIGWRTLFWIAILPGILLILGMQFAVESPRWLSKVGRWGEAEDIIRNLWGDSNVETAMEELKNAAKSMESTTEISWPELLSKRYYTAPAIGSALFALQQFAGINGVLYFSSLTFRDAGITNSMSASAIVALANLLGALSALYLMDRQGRRNCLMGSYTGMAVAMAILFISLDHNVGEQLSHSLAISGTLLYVYTFALGAGPVTALIIPELTSTQARAKTMAVSLCVHWVCNFVIGLFFLEFVEHFGLSTVYASFGVVSLLSVAFSNAFVIETKGRSLEEIEGLFNPARE